jgi:hypothetical protein
MVPRYTECATISWGMKDQRCHDMNVERPKDLLARTCGCADFQLQPKALMPHVIMTPAHMYCTKDMAKGNTLHRLKYLKEDPWKEHKTLGEIAVFEFLTDATQACTTSYKTISPERYVIIFKDDPVDQTALASYGLEPFPGSVRLLAVKSKRKYYLTPAPPSDGNLMVALHGSKIRRDDPEHEAKRPRAETT